MHVIAGTTSCTEGLNGECRNPIAGVLLSRTIPTEPSTCLSHLLYHFGAPLVSCMSPCQPYYRLHVYLSFISLLVYVFGFGLMFFCLYYMQNGTIAPDVVAVIHRSATLSKHHAVSLATYYSMTSSGCISCWQRRKKVLV